MLLVVLSSFPFFSLGKPVGWCPGMLGWDSGHFIGSTVLEAASKGSHLRG